MSVHIASSFHFRRGSRCLCRTFSEANNTGPASRKFPSRTSLELESTLIKPFLFSIERLPEISQALEARKASKTVNLDDLERAAKVFSSIQPGGHEHKAALALIVECQDPASAIKTLENLKQYHHNVQEEYALDISLAKLLWLNGNFVEAETICTNLLQNDDITGPLPMYAAAARTGQAVSRLCLADSLDDVFAIRDPFRMVVRSLEPVPSNALALALLNFGTAEAIYAQIVARENDVEVPLDGAMRAWKQGLTTLKRIKEPSPLSFAIQAQLHTQMAWGILHMEDEKDNIKRASEFAGDALKIYDRHGGRHEEGKRRTLGIIGSCLHRTSSAVTAEGIYKSAIDSKGVHLDVLETVQLRECIFLYAKLCQEWENRERDADQLSERADEIDSILPAPWRRKSVIYSTLWFWTPSLLSKASV
jgi:hypothetical protein